MINLLPPDFKTGYLYARRNVGLRRWVILFSISLIGMGIVATYGLVTLRNSIAHYNKAITTAEVTLKKEDLVGTQKRIKDISGSFKLVVDVLSQEVLFSQLIKQIGATIPEKTKLTGLNISQVQGSIDIAAVATDYNAATQVQVNLADPNNKIFNKADILGITCESKPVENALSEADIQRTLYPCTVNIRALFAPNNPYLFINSKGLKP